MACKTLTSTTSLDCSVIHRFASLVDIIVSAKYHGLQSLDIQKGSNAHKMVQTRLQYCQGHVYKQTSSDRCCVHTRNWKLDKDYIGYSTITRCITRLMHTSTLFPLNAKRGHHKSKQVFPGAASQAGAGCAVDIAPDVCAERRSGYAADATSLPTGWLLSDNASPGARAGCRRSCSPPCE